MVVKSVHLSEENWAWLRELGFNERLSMNDTVSFVRRKLPKQFRGF